MIRLIQVSPNSVSTPGVRGKWYAYREGIKNLGSHRSLCTYRSVTYLDRDGRWNTFATYFDDIFQIAEVLGPGIDVEVKPWEDNICPEINSTGSANTPVNDTSSGVTTPTNI